MLWIKAFHIIFMVTWFSGLFYLPRLYVYHSEALDDISKERFKIMERKLYYMITTPGAILTVIFGLLLLKSNLHFYTHAVWMQLKLGLVLILILYHLYLGKLLHQFQIDKNQHSTKFYRWVNEIPTIILILIIILVVVKPI